MLKDLCNIMYPTVLEVCSVVTVNLAAILCHVPLYSCHYRGCYRSVAVICFSHTIDVVYVFKCIRCLL